MTVLTTAVAALFLGTASAVATGTVIRRERQMLGLPPNTRFQRYLRAICVIAVMVLLAMLFQVASFQLRVLDIDEVQPSGNGRNWRFAYHLLLFCLLVIATAIDFDCYTIPDLITVPGMLMGVIGACVLTEMQICHLWVDWTTAIPQLRGPMIPTWYDAHRVWHAAAWSLVGLVAGAGITWLARFCSSRVLGQEAMGLGDVTLMAMIGSFIGWQAVILVFLIAPLTGLTIGLLVRILTGKTYLPYGPWLSIATVIVLFLWNRLWKITRLTFSDWYSMTILLGVGGAGFLMLLWLLQLYKAIPTRSRSAAP